MIFVFNDRVSDANSRVVIWQTLHRFQIESISECKYISYMADLLDFRLSPKMHIKIKVFMGFLPKYNGMCKSIA